tara:strand:- start:514 stop:714 length:201 start_codon:yes stop_codon:yes gene_type:complete
MQQKKIEPMFRHNSKVLHDLYDQYPAPTGTVTSDGGSSSYYELEVDGTSIESDLNKIIHTCNKLKE